jgi:hypothetical protein
MGNLPQLAAATVIVVRWVMGFRREADTYAQPKNM